VTRPTPQSSRSRSGRFRADRRRAGAGTEHLFDVGADLCNPIGPDPAYPHCEYTDSVTRLEGWCDEFNADLP
jgi:hypothetical protein